MADRFGLRSDRSLGTSVQLGVKSGRRLLQTPISDGCLEASLPPLGQSSAAALVQLVHSISARTGFCNRERLRGAIHFHLGVATSFSAQARPVFGPTRLRVSGSASRFLVRSAGFVSQRCRELVTSQVCNAEKRIGRNRGLEWTSNIGFPASSMPILCR